MRTLSIVGTAAMFLVGGGILVHGIPAVAELLHHFEEWLQAFAVGGNLLAIFGAQLYNGLFGMVIGAILVGLLTVGQRFMPKKAEQAVD